MFETVVTGAKAVLSFFAATDFTGIILLVFLIIVGMMLYRLNQSPSTKFFYDQLFVDKNGSASTSKLGHLTALMLSSWAFIHLTLKGTLTEWYFLTYMSVWVLQRSYSKWIDLKAANQTELQLSDAAKKEVQK